MSEFWAAFWPQAIATVAGAGVGVLGVVGVHLAATWSANRSAFQSAAADAIQAIARYEHEIRTAKNRPQFAYNDASAFVPVNDEAVDAALLVLIMRTTPRRPFRRSDLESIRAHISRDDFGLTELASVREAILVSASNTKRVDALRALPEAIRSEITGRP